MFIRAKEGPHFHLEESNERRLHEFELIRDVETNDPLASQVLAKFFRKLASIVFSMTKMTSLHARRSEHTGVSASGFSPAEATSKPGRFAKTRSAVGLRSRFWLQMKSTFFIQLIQSEDR